MKKTITFFAAITFSAILFGQIRITNNKSVGIHTNNPLSKVSVGENSNPLYYFSINSPLTAENSQALRVVANYKASKRYSIVSYTPSGSGWAYGLCSGSYTPTPSSSGRAYGIYAYAGNSTNGYNYGIKASLHGSNNGSAVFGTIAGADYPIPGKYAGFFYGDVKVTGNAWVNGSTLVTSDINLKKDIKNLEKDCTEKLKQLHALKYKLKTQIEIEAETASSNNINALTKTASPMNVDAVTETDTVVTVDLNPEMEAVYNKERIGLSAQEVQKVYPELVVEGQDGTLGVDYIGLIPILIEAIKEQQEQLEKQELEINKLKADNSDKIIGTGD